MMRSDVVAPSELSSGKRSAWEAFRTQPPAPKSPPPIQRGGWLDGLRFVVACLIIINHYQAAGPVPLVTFHPFFERTYLFTDFFLIDSGYVLARIYCDQILAGQMTVGVFMRKRLGRVIPAHLIMCIAMVILVTASNAAGVAPRHREWFDWSQLPAQFFLVQAYGVPGGIGWNAPSWSISALLGCYLAFPLLLRGMTRHSPWSVLALSAAAYAVANVLATSVLGDPIYLLPLKYGFVRALPLFIVGMALARFAHQVYLPPRLAKVMGGTAMLGLIGLQVFGPFGLASLGLIAIIILAAGAIPLRRPSKLVEKAAIVSFSMFITNEVVRVAWFGVVNVLETRLGWSIPVQWALWAGGVATAVAFAIAFHVVVDMPTQAWIKARLGRNYGLGSAGSVGAAAVAAANR
jgi:peptidoglycan/LPS O-acetylase OafA/YrhL